MGIFSVNLTLNNNYLDDTNFGNDDPDTIILVRLSAWHITFEKRKAHKKMKGDELMPIAWHPKRWWNVCAAEDVKKKIEPIFTEEL